MIAGISRMPRAQHEQFVRYAESNVPLEYGTFRVIVYRERKATGDEATPYAREHLALVYGDVRKKKSVLARVHSECLTGEVLHSLKCECREQLDYALRAVAKEGAGVVFYLRQEGRGIGLGNKIRAYALQEKGVDTVDANRQLGFPDDARDFEIAAYMCRDLGIESLRLMTNNPLKIQKLRAAGIPIAKREPILIAPNPHNAAYMETKRVRMGHQLSLTADESSDDTE